VLSPSVAVNVISTWVASARFWRRCHGYGYRLQCVDDLQAMLTAHGDWMALGSADEQKQAVAGTVEAWARSPENPVGGWYGVKKGLRGRFANYVPPLMEHLGLAELEHNARNNRMRAR
jgi:hypothetical protein